jgi:hypothetical protein
MSNEQRKNRESGTQAARATRGQQDQTSKQSMTNPTGSARQQSSGSAAAGGEEQTGIGSSQGQDRGTGQREGTERPSAGTADIERGSSHSQESSGGPESMVNDSTGAFKERP